MGFHTDVYIVGNRNAEAYKEVFQIFISKLDDLGVTLVTAAGNKGLDKETTADAVPQCLGTSDNNVITIGGLNYDGTLWILTTPEAPGGKSGSITAYGLATDLTMMDAFGTIDPTSAKLQGTSGATSIAVCIMAIFFLRQSL